MSWVKEIAALADPFRSLRIRTFGLDFLEQIRDCGIGLGEANAVKTQDLLDRAEQMAGRSSREMVHIAIALLL